MAGDIKKYSRRDFIHGSLKGTAGFMAYPIFRKAVASGIKSPFTKSRVVVVKDDGAFSNYRIDQNVVQIMVDAGIRALTGINDVGEAWKSLFTGITQSSVIGIKANCIARQGQYGLATHPEFAYAIANSLTQMQVEGQSFPEDNILIWDRSNYELTRSGFTINKNDPGVKCYGTKGPIMNDGSSSYGYSTDVQYDVNGVGQYLSKILVEKSDYLINTCLLKDHSSSGVTLSLKNHYGSCWNPNGMHDGHCDPYIAVLNTLPPIKEKQVINICDAIKGIVSGGPMGMPQVTPKSLIFSKDPVAHDTIGCQMLREYGTTSAAIDMATHIATAANAPYNLGINDPDQIELINILNPTTGVDDIDKNTRSPKEFHIFQNYPNPFNMQTTLSYRLYKPADLRIHIYNHLGQFIRLLNDESQNEGYHRIPWDGKTSNGDIVPSGTYLVRFDVGGSRHVLRMQVVK